MASADSYWTEVGIKGDWIREFERMIRNFSLINQSKFIKVKGLFIVYFLCIVYATFQRYFTKNKCQFDDKLCPVSLIIIREKNH